MTAMQGVIFTDFVEMVERRFSLRENVLTLMPAEGRADPLVRFRREFGTSSKGPGAPKP